MSLFFRTPLVFLLAAVTLIAVMLGTPAHADEMKGAELARSQACLACHQVDAKRVGPPFRDIGKRYAAGTAERGAIMDYLALSIREGGRGKWGAIPMPAQPRVSEADAKVLADWILSLGASAP